KVKVTLKQLVIPVDGKVQQAKARAEEILRTVKGCDAMDAMIRKVGGLSGDLGTVRVGDMPEQLGRLVSALPVGQPSPPYGNQQEMYIVMVCERTGGKPVAAPAPAPAPVPVAAPAPKLTPDQIKLPPREEIQQALTIERMDMLARRYLRDLRRAAFIEIRV
ncbi:MAG TPA: peptidylprolyl isomerase, partial [Azospirillaceae bacterium]|nr:peptidylprolyl isomerase [Azospirillaceae bacterium]